MRNLIAINQSSINNEAVQTVNARELHAFLESNRQFGNWIQERIEQYGFIKDQDFLTVLLKTPSGGRPSKEYHLTIDMAKELSMVERNEKGREARKYFIACEKKAKSNQIKVDGSGLLQFRQARAIKMATDSAKEICSMFPSLSEQSKQVVVAGLVNPIVGAEVIPLPRLEHKTYSATEVGDRLGISSKKVGRIANELGLKTAEYGMYVLDKSAYSTKQVESFRYFEKAIEVIGQTINQAS